MQIRRALKVYLRIVKRVFIYWYYWLALFVVVSVVATIYAMRLPDMYTSKAKVMIAPALMRHLLDRDGYSGPDMEYYDWHHRIQQLFLTRARMSKVIQEFNLFPYTTSKKTMDDAIEEFYTYIEVYPIGRDMFYVGFRHEDPKVAKNVVERLIQLFIQENQQDKTRVVENTAEVLEKRIEETEKQLFKAEDELKEFKNKYQNEVALIEAKKVGAIRFTELEQHVQKSYADLEGYDSPELRRLLAQKRELEEELRLLRAKREADPQQSREYSEIRELEEELQSLKDREKKLLSIYTEEYPDVKIVRKEIGEVKQRLESLRQKLVLKSSSSPIEGNIAEVLKRLDELDKRIVELKRELVKGKKGEVVSTKEDTRGSFQPLTLSEIETEYNRLLRNVESIKDTYQALLARRAQSKTLLEAEQIAGSNEFRIIEPPTYPEKPSWPNRPKYILAGVGAGFFLGFLLALVLSLMDSRIYYPSDVESIEGLRVVAIIPPIEDIIKGKEKS